MYRLIFKHFLDYLLAIVIFLPALPVMTLIAILLYIFNHKNVFFIQQRPGYKEKPFHIYKFKTMNDATSSDGALLSDDERLTTFGKFLRATSLDELPQLINILKGDLSFIGPRPLLMEYLDHYTNEQNRRHQAKPGITGLAQVSGRNQLSWDERFKLDVYYVENLSFGLDLRIIFKTVAKVISRDGVTVSENQVSPQPFKGSDS